VTVEIAREYKDADVLDAKLFILELPKTEYEVARIARCIAESLGARIHIPGKYLLWL
jgi:hypothetical protein